MDETMSPTGRVEPVDGGFAAHVEDEKGLVEGPVGGFAVLADAVAWCRARSDVVVVRAAPGDVLRSAGERPPPWRPDMPRLSA